VAMRWFRFGDVAKVSPPDRGGSQLAIGLSALVGAVTSLAGG
jgi:hypothetical protein